MAPTQTRQPGEGNWARLPPSPEQSSQGHPRLCPGVDGTVPPPHADQSLVREPYIPRSMAAGKSPAYDCHTRGIASHPRAFSRRGQLKNVTAVTS